MTAHPEPNRVPVPRVLLIARSCNAHGMLLELLKRSDGWFCPARNKREVPAGMKLLNFSAARRLRKAIGAGAYDLVISFDNPEPVWRGDKGWLNNLFKAVKKFAWKSDTLGTYLVPWMLAGSEVPLAVYDWDDNTIIARKNWPLLERSTCYFKTQTPRNPYKAFLFQDPRNDCLFNIVRQPRHRAEVKKLRPHCVGVTIPEKLRDLAAEEKRTDVFFAGAFHYSWVREEGARHLEEMKAEGYRIDLFSLNSGQPPLPQEEFLRRCAQAWLVWSPEGAGWDCARHYWAPLLGSVPILNDPDTRRHHPLRDGVHAFYYQVEGDDLKRVVRGALKDKERLREMARAGEAWVRRHHTHEALADYMIAETLRAAKDVEVVEAARR